MSEKLIRVQETRNLIADWQTREAGYPPTQQVVRYVGELAALDPEAGVMVAEGIADPSIRINALVQVSDSTRNVGPIIDAIDIAQSETIPEPRRGRKLEFIAYHALAQEDVALAVDIARGIENAAPRARVLLAVARQEKDTALLKEVDQLSADHKLGRSIDRSLMREGKETEQYRVGVNAAKREHARLARSTTWGISEEGAQFKNAQYVVGCVVDALDKGNAQTLDPIANDVAEALAVAADLSRERWEGKTTRYINYGFSISDVDKLAVGFGVATPEASKALYGVVKKMADHNIKRITKRMTNRRAVAKEPAVSIVDEGIGLLNLDEITAKLGLVDDDDVATPNDHYDF